MSSSFIEASVISDLTLMELYYNSAAALPFCLNRPQIMCNITVNLVPFKIHLDKFFVVPMCSACCSLACCFGRTYPDPCTKHAKICTGKVFLELDKKLFC